MNAYTLPGHWPSDEYSNCCQLSITANNVAEDSPVPAPNICAYSYLSKGQIALQRFSRVPLPSRFHPHQAFGLFRSPTLAKLMCIKQYFINLIGTYLIINEFEQPSICLIAFGFPPLVKLSIAFAYFSLVIL